MKSTVIWRVVGGAAVLAGIIIALTPFNLAHICTGTMELKNGMHVAMKCNWMGVAEVFLGVLVACNGILMLLSKGDSHGLSYMLGALGIAVIVVPTDFGFGICPMPGMACHTTKAVLSLSGTVLIAMALVAPAVSKSLARVPLKTS